MSQPTTWPTWLAALFVTSLFSFCMGYSLHWAIARDDARSGNVAEAAPDSADAQQTSRVVREGSREGSVARHFFVAVNGLWITPETREWMADVRPGGVVLRAENIQSPAQVLQLVRDLKEAAGSATQRLSEFPIVMLNDPAEAARSLAWDADMATAFAGAFPDAQLAGESAQGLARACAAMGVNVIFGPTLAQQEREFNRGFGNELPTGTQISTTAAAYTKGLIDGGVLPIVKYFPRGTEMTAFGAASGGVSQLAEAMLPFEEAVAQGTPGILVGHSPVPELDPNHPDRPASQSPLMVTDLLRGRWGFTGVVIADDITRRAATGDRTPGEAAVEALKAGCDAVVFLDPSPESIRAACAAVKSAGANGVLDPRALERSMRRIEVWQTWLDRPLPMPMAEAPQPANSMIARSYDPPARAAPTIAPQHVADAPPQPAPELTDWVEPVAATPVELHAPTGIAETTDAESVQEPVVGVQTPEQPVTELPAEQEPVEVASAPEPVQEDEAPVEETSIAVAAPTVPPAEQTPAEAARELPAPPEEPAEETVVASLPPDASEMAPEAVSEPESANESEEGVEESAAPDVQPKETPREPEPTDPEPPIDGAEEERDVAPVVHVVAEGDTLSGIAAEYDVTVEDVMRWNALDGQQINLGAKLTVYRGAAPDVDRSGDEQETPVEEAAPEPVSVASEKTGDASAEPTPASAAFSTHEIKPGDTLTQIARTYGVTQAELLEINGLDNPNQIIVGRQLRVPR